MINVHVEVVLNTSFVMGRVCKNMVDYKTMLLGGFVPELPTCGDGSFAQPLKIIVSQNKYNKV